MEIVVDTGLLAVARVELDGAGEIGQAILCVAGDGVENGKAIVGVVGGGVVSEDPGELLPGVFIVPGVELRDRVIVTLLGSKKGETGLLELALAGGNVHLAALLDFDRSIGK